MLNLLVNELYTFAYYGFTLIFHLSDILCVLSVLCGEITCNFLSNLFGQPKNLINFANLLRNNKKLII